MHVPRHAHCLRRLTAKRATNCSATCRTGPLHDMFANPLKMFNQADLLVASAKICAIASVPFSRSYAVFQSRSILVNKCPACSAIHGHTECVTASLTAHFSSIAWRIVRRCSSSFQQDFSRSKSTALARCLTSRCCPQTPTQSHETTPSAFVISIIPSTSSGPC